MNRCIPPEQLRRLLAGQLSPAEQQALEAHVDACGPCQDLLARLLDGAGEGPPGVDWRLLRGGLAATAEVPDDFLRRLKGALPGSTPTGPPDAGPATDILFPEPPTPLGPLGRLESYHIVAELGRGAFGLVFKAHDEKLDCLVALKVLRPELAASAADRARFEGEARKAAAVRHDHAVAIYRVGSTPGFALPYFVMEYIDGEALSVRLERQGVLGPREAAEIVRQAALGLAAAHARGLVHRDVKPGNILLERASGRAKISDFGLARTLEVRTEKLTQSGGIVGTPPYMSPEQVTAPQQADPRSDVYGLGAVLYEMLTGGPPFRGLTHLVFQQVVHEEPRPPRRLNDTVPRDLETICLHCLHKEPGRRYAGAAALAEDLGRFLAGEPIAARPVRAWERGWKWARRRPAVAALLGLVVLVTALGFGSVTWQWRQTEAARRRLATQAGELEINNYFTKIALADRELAAENWGRAEELLDECPEGRRGWEYYYLKRLRHAPPVSFPVDRRAVMGEGFDLAFSPDGRLLAIPGAGNDVHVWDVPGNRMVLSLRGHGARVLALAFSPDGHRLASTSEDRTVKLWDLPTPGNLPPAGAPVLSTALTLVGHKGRVIGVAFSPAPGRLLASADDRGGVKVWDAATGERLRDLPGQSIPNPCVHLAFSPDGRRLAWGSHDNTVKVWDAASGREVFTLAGHSAPVLSVTFSPDGRHLVSAGRDRRVNVWGLPSGEGGAAPEALTPRYTLDHVSVAVWCMAVSPDGRLLVVGGAFSDGTVRVHDLATGEMIRRLQGHVRVVSVAFSPDGRRLTSAGLDRIIRLWDVTTGHEILTLRGHRDTVGRVLFSPDGQRLASAGNDGTVHVWDASPFDEDADPRVVTLRGHTGDVYGVAFSPDGERLASAGGDTSVRLWDARTGRQVRAFRGHRAAVLGVAFSPDGRRLLSGSNDETAKLWDALTGDELRTLTGFKGMVRSVAFSPDGRTFATGAGQTIQLWDARTGGPLGRSRRPDGEHIQCVQFSPDGKRVASSGYRTLTLWDAAGLEHVRSFPGHRTRVYGVAFRPDGRRLASGDCDGHVKIWDAETGREVRTLSGHTDYVSAVAFSPDGRRLATASWREVILWDANTLERVQTLGRLAGTIWCVAFSPDGRRLAAGSGYKGKGEIKIWDRALWDRQTDR